MQDTQTGWSMWNGIKDFSEGYIDKIEDHLLPDNASPDCQNVIASEIGSLRIRGGQARLLPPGPILKGVLYGQESESHVQGMHAYYRGNSRWLVVATGGRTLYWDPEEQGYVLLRGEFGKELYSRTAPVCFATCATYMVSFNGVDVPWKWNGTTVSELANAPEDGQFAVLYKEKLFTVPKSEPSTLVWSDSFQPESWPAVNSWDVRTGDGDVITCILEHLGELVVFKRRSTNTLAGTDLDTFRFDTRHTSIGCVGPFAAASKEPYVYFVSEEGLCVWNGMTVINLSMHRIPNLWERVNKEYLHKAAVGIWGSHIWFAVPEGNSTYNNLVIVCEHTDETARFWPWRGINASCFVQYNDGLSLSYFSGCSGGSDTGGVIRQCTGTDDFGQPIYAYWHSKSFDVGAPEYLKKFKEVYITDSPRAQDISLQAALDYGKHHFLQHTGEDDLVRRYRFAPGSYGRYLSLKLLHESTEDAEVRGLAVLYRPRRRMR